MTQTVARLVAAFIGFHQMWPDYGCTAQLCSLHGVWTIPVPDRVRDAIRKAGCKEVVLGLRPEDLVLKLEAQPGSLAGNIFVIEPLADRKIVDVQLGEDIVKVKARPAMRFKVGQRTWLAPNLDRLHVFGRETERTLA